MTSNATTVKDNGLGKRIKAARLEADVTIRQLAEDTGVDPRTVAGWQAGRSKPSYERLRIVAVRLRKPLAYFLEDGSEAAA